MNLVDKKKLLFLSYFFFILTFYYFVVPFIFFYKPFVLKVNTIFINEINYLNIYKNLNYIIYNFISIILILIFFFNFKKNFQKNFIGKIL
jgi:hypothetical protein